MCNFYNLWALLRQHGSSAKKENECAQLWATFSPELQLKIFNTIKTKLEQNKFVHYDPMRAYKKTHARKNSKHCHTQNIMHASTPQNLKTDG